MPRDILSEFGPESPRDRDPGFVDGGVKRARDVMGYQPPQGPRNIMESATPGLHGDIYRSGSQGPASTPIQSSGRAGLGGMNEGCGTNRKGRG